MTLRYTDSQFRANYPITRWRTVWNYENKVVLRECNAQPNTSYVFFCKNGPYYEFIIKTRDMPWGEKISKDIWHPKAKPTEASGKNFLLDHIEGMVSSMVKRGNLDDIRKVDFSAVYYGKNEWHALYPCLEDLLEFHLAKTEPHNEAYLQYLRSDDLKALREEWAKDPNVHVPLAYVGK